MQQNVNSPTTQRIPIYELIADFDLNREFLEFGEWETPEDRDRAAEEARESQSGNDWNDSEEEN